jgi:hypothetical protein
VRGGKIDGDACSWERLPSLGNVIVGEGCMNPWLEVEVEESDRHDSSSEKTLSSQSCCKCLEKWDRMAQLEGRGAGPCAEEAKDMAVRTLFSQIISVHLFLSRSPTFP